MVWMVLILAKNQDVIHDLNKVFLLPWLLWWFTFSHLLLVSLWFKKKKKILTQQFCLHLNSGVSKPLDAIINVKFLLYIFFKESPIPTLFAWPECSKLDLLGKRWWILLENACSKKFEASTTFAFHSRAFGFVDVCIVDVQIKMMVNRIMTVCGNHGNTHRHRKVAVTFPAYNT